MFYPSDALKKGGRFYWCWVADSWPSQFSSITQRQLWSQDIRRLCDDLQLLIINESGHSRNRFSLRLSSQLLRGLVRLYNKKVSTLTVEICNINAKIFKHVNQKLVPRDRTNVQKGLATVGVVANITEVPQDDNEKVEEIIQQSRNVVNSIDDITLKDPPVPVIVLTVNDGFGEETAEQMLQLAERSVEQMLRMPADVTSRSVPDLDVDKSDNKSHDRSRLAPRSYQMERLSEYDVTIGNKSMIQEFVPGEKDIPRTPEIPVIPVIPAPSPEKMIINEQDLEVRETPKKIPEPAQNLLPEDIELQELEESEPPPKRHRAKKFMDRRIKLSGAYMRSRVQNHHVELRCEKFLDDKVKIGVPAEMYFRRPACAGHNIHTNVGYTILQLFSRHLGVKRVVDTEPEQIMAQPIRINTSRMAREQIVEEEELPQIEAPLPQTEAPLPQDLTAVPDDELPTQVLETMSQTRRLTIEKDASSRKRKSNVSHILSSTPNIQKKNMKMDTNANKENTPGVENILPQTEDSSIAAMLQKVGIMDIEEEGQVNLSKEAVTLQRKRSSSETPLGSLDRTKVSLGDSVTTTESNQFIKDEWGAQGTMLKIMNAVQKGERVTVHRLVAAGPVVPGRRRVIAAKCFVSMLKLRQHGFIDIMTQENSTEITDVKLGPKFNE